MLKQHKAEESDDEIKTRLTYKTLVTFKDTCLLKAIIGEDEVESCRLERGRGSGR